VGAESSRLEAEVDFVDYALVGLGLGLALELEYTGQELRSMSANHSALRQA